MRQGASLRARAALGALGIALLLAPIAGCGGEDSRVRVPDGTPILLISVDTLRSDRLPAYGYRGVETPALDSLRTDSILFAHAYCPVPLTLPSHVSALTGLLPSEHRVRDNMGYRLDTENLPYLPRALQQLGYRTGAAVSSFVLRRTSGLDHGFDFYDDEITFKSWTDMGSVQRPGEETLDVALGWLRSVGEEPFFLFFHIYEPHTPHQPPEPFASRYPSAYDGEVAHADRVVGALLNQLRELGLYRRSVIFLMSDHGEGLNDHGDYEHGPLLYRDVLQIPLLLKLPSSRRGGDTVESPAQLTDLFPTVMDLLGQQPPEGSDGRSLLRLDDSRDAERPIFSETFFPRLHFGWSELFSVVRYPYHFIDGPDPELYDLSNDPDETENLVRAERRVASELRAELSRYDRSFLPPAEVDAETRRRLAALGYIGGGAGRKDGPLADPKSRLGILALMRTAFEHSLGGELRQAAAAFRRVVDEEPGMVDAWEQLGHTLLQLGDYAAAVDAYERAMELSGGSPQIALSAAGGYLKLGRLEEARSHAALAVDVHELARDLLAQIALRQGELDQAERLVLRALEKRGGRLGPLLTLAELRLKQGRFREAVDVTLRAEREFGQRDDPEALRGLYFTRGSALARLGEVEEAEAAFRAEIELSPGELAPYTHLAFVYGLQGRSREAGATLRSMVETNPGPSAYAEAVRTLRALGDSGSAAAVLRIGRRRWPEASELAAL